MRFQQRIVLMAAVILPLLAKAEDQSSLCINARPGRAGVFSLGEYLGSAANFKVARTYPAAVGEHEVELIDPRYEEPPTSVTIVPGEKTTISETLKALPPPKPPLGRLRTENAAI